MKSKASIKNINLPPAPPPTRANYHERIVIGDGKYIKVLPSNYQPPRALQDLSKYRKPQKPKKPTPTARAYKRQAWTEERLGTLEKLYKEGKTFVEIGEIMECSAQVAWAMATKLRKAGRIQTYRCECGWTEAQMETIIRMYNEGAAYVDIADAVGIFFLSGPVNDLRMSLPFESLPA